MKLWDSWSTSLSSLRIRHGIQPFMNIRQAACESVMTATECPFASACLMAIAMEVASAVLVQGVSTKTERVISECSEFFTGIKT